ncbi:hypothetical protein [Janthinobacterium sp. CG3]|uniref:hypothetical protein n=1 Tax=Janthinobacterium sp. CG3 TaxID=1075768 RepID=UPI001E3CC5AE|nr:hypothetical protein [Janthinobacterium sp. CG3]
MEIKAMREVDVDVVIFMASRVMVYLLFQSSTCRPAKQIYPAGKINTVRWRT